MPANRPPKTVTLTAGWYTAAVTYKKIKKLYLRVRDGAISVSAPIGTPKDYIRRFILSSSGYIDPRLEETAVRKREFVTGETVRLWGAEYPLELSPGGRHTVTFTGTAFHMTAPPDSSPEKREKALAEFYRRETLAAASKRMPELEKAAGLSSSGLRIKNMTSRWGSCNVKTKLIALNLRLAMFPPRCLDQVIVHELIHTVIPWHGRDFHAMMDSLMPDWKARSDELKAGGVKI